MGHAGTLDPLATGVLVVPGRGDAARRVPADTDKEYRAVGSACAPTWDADGTVIEERDASGVSREAVEAALAEFVGRIAQVPPMYSALKREGEPLYRLARRGVSVEREPREVDIYAVRLEVWAPPDVVFTVRCGKGTYVRSLAYDLGEPGVGAHIAQLRRLAVGDLRTEGAVALDALEAAGEGVARAPPVPRRGARASAGRGPRRRRRAARAAGRPWRWSRPPRWASLPMTKRAR